MKLDEYLALNEEKENEEDVVVEGYHKEKLTGKSFKLKDDYASKDELPDPNLLVKDPGEFFEGDLESEEFKKLMKDIATWQEEELDDEGSDLD